MNVDFVKTNITKRSTFDHYSKTNSSIDIVVSWGHPEKRNKFRSRNVVCTQAGFSKDTKVSDKKLLIWLSCLYNLKYRLHL